MNNTTFKKKKDFEILGDYSVAGEKHKSDFDNAVGQGGAAGLNTEAAKGKGTQKISDETNGITALDDVKGADTKPPLYDEETDTYAVRQSLENAGIDDIGWEDGRVVSHGVSLVPAVNRDGTAYAKKSDIHSYINDVKAASGDPLVRVNSYNNKYGMTGLVNYDEKNKRVTVDGEEVSYVYIDDDANAWASKNALDLAYDNAAKRRGITSGNELLKTYEDKMTDAKFIREGVADRVKDWDFTREDLMKDPVYNAYKQMYIRDGIRAYKDTMNDMASRNGGNLSGAAIQAAGASYNRYLEKMNEAVPEIANMAYNRFLKGQQYDYQNSEMLEKDAGKLFSLAYGISRDALSNQQKTAEDSYNRYVRQLQLDSLRDSNSYTKKYNDSKLEAAEEAYRQSIRKAALEEARALGYYSDSAAAVLGIERDENGSYPSVNYADINRETELYENASLPKYLTELAINTAFERDSYEYKLGTSFWNMVLNDKYKKERFIPDYASYSEMIQQMLNKN